MLSTHGKLRLCFFRSCPTQTGWSWSQALAVASSVHGLPHGPQHGTMAPQAAGLGGFTQGPGA